jgi:hypothetical protein
LLIQLPCDHDHDGPRLYSNRVTFNINIMLHSFNFQCLAHITIYWTNSICVSFFYNLFGDWLIEILKVKKKSFDLYNNKLMIVVLCTIWQYCTVLVCIVLKTHIGLDPCVDEYGLQYNIDSSVLSSVSWGERLFFFLLILMKSETYKNKIYAASQNLVKYRSH